MISLRAYVARPSVALFVTAALVALTCCSKKSIVETGPVDLQVEAKSPLRFVVYGDTRFHDPKDTEAANPAARQALVYAIADAGPAFVCFTGDIVYNGFDANDWKEWESETSAWRDRKIEVFPALGNHDVHGDPKIALGNYFQHFPELKESRYYSVRSGDALILVLDSNQEELTGAQGEWLGKQFDHVPSDVDFLFVMDHHPPYTSSSDSKLYGGGHAARPAEQALAKFLEERQTRSHFRVVVFSGHVHNYERHEHGGVTYFVSGGGGAHAYPIERAKDDPYQSKDVNYHYLLAHIDGKQLTVTMNRLDMASGKPLWTQPDVVKLTPP